MSHECECEEAGPKWGRGVSGRFCKRLFELDLDQREQGLVVARPRVIRVEGGKMSREIPRGMMSTTGPVKAEAQMPSGRKKTSVLGQGPKGDCINFTFSSKLWKTIS